MYRLSASFACGQRCCVVGYDPEIGLPGGLFVRPMYQVLLQEEEWSDGAEWHAYDEGIPYELWIEELDGKNRYWKEGRDE